MVCSSGPWLGLRTWQGGRQEVLATWGCPGTQQPEVLGGVEALEAPGPRHSRWLSAGRSWEHRNQLASAGASGPTCLGNAGPGPARWPLSHMASLGYRTPARSPPPGRRRAMCWASAFRSVGWRRAWGLGRGTGSASRTAQGGPARTPHPLPQPCTAQPAAGRDVGAQVRWAFQGWGPLALGSCVPTQCVCMCTCVCVCVCVCCVHTVRRRKERRELLLHPPRGAPCPGASQLSS